MMATHLCAHPLIPGYANPSPEGIRYWAVMPKFFDKVKRNQTTHFKETYRQVLKVAAKS
ncbi:hypothetical protein F5888DRAFT_1734721 [Russula emetica]|nr:hypothetical protein F5888DRAFT_1734721 [Russula emetica]